MGKKIEGFTTDQAREYLVEFTMENFSDKTFHRYIRGQQEASLAGDFAWQMATSLARRTDELALTRAEVNAMVADADHAIALIDAAKAVVDFIDGDLPTRGWLRDNDASRTALSNLRKAVVPRPSAAPDTCAEMRALCGACGGTGDVHRDDGEWLGECDCEASKWARNGSSQSIDLHTAIMNIPCKRTMSHFATRDDLLIHKEGHRDARHAAAELSIAMRPSSAPTKRERELDAALTQTIGDREQYHEWADRLAGAIGMYFGVDIGEHSNANCPWAEALDAAPDTPAAPVHVKIDRSRVWIVSGVQSFMLAYEADADVDREWYANQLRGALGLIAPCVMMGISAPSQPDRKQAREAASLPVELQGVHKQKDEGFWHSCSGCYDTEDGHPTGSYAHSAVFGCALGSGCHECGGLGVIWDNSDYSDGGAAPAPTYQHAPADDTEGGAA